MAAWGRLGLGAWGLAQLAWVWGGVDGGSGAFAIVGFVVGGVGMLVASFSPLEDRPARWTVGVALALVGILPFFAENFIPLGSIDGYFYAALTYLLGLLALVAGGSVAARTDVSATVLNLVRGGGALAAIAAIIWTPLDGFGSSWTLGNLLQGVGAVLVAAFPRG